MQKVHVNNPLRMEKIKWIGFDMDATLAVYNLKEYEPYLFERIKRKLIDYGYPKELMSYKYDPTFAIRGAWYDKKHGNLMKMDEYSNVLAAWSGFRKLSGTEIKTLYPNKHIILSNDGTRSPVLNTIFDCPSTYLLACLGDMFSKSTTYELMENKSGYIYGSSILTFLTIFVDTFKAQDAVLCSDGYKNHFMENVSKFVLKDARAIPFLVKLKNSGKRLFLLTNSDYKFSKAVMTYVYGEKWAALFDVVIVNGCKPSWFSSSDLFREVDEKSGYPLLGYHRGPLKYGHIYSGGSVTEFRRYTDLTGKDTLYVGDHIYGDVLHSKKTGGWRTLLIVPELDRELSISEKQKTMFVQICGYDYMIDDDTTLGPSDSYSDRGCSKQVKEQRRNFMRIRELTQQMEKAYSEMGSMMRLGPRRTWFAGQMSRYADIYTGCVYNMLNYDVDQNFHAQLRLLPHEVTQKSKLSAQDVRGTDEEING